MSGVTDMEISWDGGTAYMYATTGSEGGATAFRLSGSGSAQVVDQIAYTTAQLQSGDASIALVASGSTTYFVSYGSMDSSLTGHALAGGDDFQSASAMNWSGSGAGGQMNTLTTVTVNGATYVYAASVGTSGLSHYEAMDNRQLQIRSDQSQSAELPDGIDIVAFATIETGGQTFLLAASNLHQGVSSYILDANGTPTFVDVLGAADGVGIADPTAIECFEVAGECFVVVAAAGSSSLTVMKIQSDGTLSPVDHIIDNLNTRFDNVAELEVVAVDGRTYVLAGGADDGISIFTVLPSGQLVLLASVADTMDTALQNVSALAAEAVDGTIQVYAASESEAGITQLSFDTGNIGQTLNGSSTADTITGGAADDMLAGGGGDDILNGSGGNDILSDGSGSDQMTGGSGNDIFVLTADGALDVIHDYDPARDSLDLTAFNFLYTTSQLTIIPTSYGCRIEFRGEVIEIHSADGAPLTADDFPTSSILTLDRPPVVYDYMPLEVQGTSGADTLNGNLGDDTLYGLGGADMLEGSEGGDHLDGGSGTDTAVYTNAYAGVGVSLLSGSGWDGAAGDTLVAIENLIGSAHADTLIGNNGRNTLNGGAGSDILEGRDGNDILEGGFGVDTLNGGEGSDILNGGGGNDTVTYKDETTGMGLVLDTGATWGSADGDTLISIENVTGTDHSDNITGSAEANTLTGDGGDDILDGRQGADILYGGAGDDILRGGWGSYDDALYGGDGNDILSGDAGLDVIDGGDGIDTVSYETDPLGAMGINLAAGTTWGGAWGDEVSNVENVIGSSGNDTIVGDSGVNVLDGSDGNDVLDGREGNDTIYGGDGDDTLRGGWGDGKDLMYGGDGDDTLEGGNGNDWMLGGTGSNHYDGGSGNDTACYSDILSGPVQVNLTTGAATGGAAGDTFDSIENLWGSWWDDTLTGDAGKNVISGGWGSDEVYGLAGHDILYGGGGDDVLVGGSGDYNDFLHGGAGNDTLTGGAGADKFVFHGGGHDIATDFDASEYDKLMFDDDLWGGGPKSTTDILEYATVVGNSVVFDFGGGNTATIQGVTDIASLDGSIYVI